MGSNHAHSSKIFRVLKLISRVRAAHHATNSDRADGVSYHAHVFRQRAFGAVERTDFFSGLRAAHHDAFFAELIEIVCVQGMAQLEHHVVRDIHHVIDGFLADGFEALAQPVRRRLNFHAAQYARGESPAKFRRFDLNARGIGDFFRGLLQLRMQRLERQSINGRDFARDAEVAQAVRTIRRDFRVQHRAGGGFFDRIHGDPGEREPRAQIGRRRRHVHELFQPVVDDFHFLFVADT